MEVRLDLVAGGFEPISKKEVSTTRSNTLATSFMIVMFSCLGFLPVQAQEKAPAATTRVRMTVTVRLLDQNRRMPDVNRKM